MKIFFAKKKLLSIMLFCAVMLNVQLLAFANQDPIDQLKPFVDKIISTLSSPEFKSLSKNDQGEHLLIMVKERFDFAETSKRVLGQQWSKLSHQEQAEFIDIYTRFLKDVYIEKIDNNSEQKITFVGQRVKNGRAEVQTLLVDKQKTIAINYIMLLRGNDWLIYDVVAEEVSLVRNYAEQFRDILSKEGYPSLVRQIKKKIRKLEEE